MADFLTLAGVPYDVVQDDATEDEPERIGTPRLRTWSGNLRSTVRATFRRAKCSVAVSAAQLTALRAALLAPIVSVGGEWLGGTIFTVTVTGAGAAIGAVAVPVSALAGPIVGGTVLTFTGGKLATVAAAGAAAGAVSIPTLALAAAIPAAATATHTPIIRASVLLGTVTPIEDASLGSTAQPGWQFIAALDIAQAGTGQ